MIRKKTISTQKPSVDLCDAMIAGKFQSSPKLEKFKPLISFVEEHLNMMGSLEKES
jgi:hypothetical protein